MFTAGIMLRDDICLLMLIRYGGPSLQMDFVSFVLLMLRVEKTESELPGGREGGASSALLLDCPCAPSSGRREDSCQCRNGRAGSRAGRWLHACQSPLHLPTLTRTLPSPEAEV